MFKFICMISSFFIELGSVIIIFINLKMLEKMPIIWKKSIFHQRLRIDYSNLRIT